MGLKKIYSKTKKSLTSPKAKKFYSNVGKAAVKTGRYFQQVDRNLDKTFSIPKKYPDRTLSNYNLPPGYKLVKEPYIANTNRGRVIVYRTKVVKIKRKKKKK